jgi:hypothetical protein
MAVTAIKPRNAVESLREIAQDIIVPDMKAIKMEVESHRRETKSDIESLRNEVKPSAIHCGARCDFAMRSKPRHCRPSRIRLGTRWMSANALRFSKIAEAAHRPLRVK